MIKMLKKYERAIAILLIAFLAVPVNLFTSIATVLAEDNGRIIKSQIKSLSSNCCNSLNFPS